MRHAHSTKVADTLTDVVADTVSLGTSIIDTVGFDGLVIVIDSGLASADLDAITLDQSTAADMSGSTNLITFQTTEDVAGNTNPLADFDTGESIRFDVDLPGKKRYMKVTLTSGAASTELSYTAILTRPTIGLDDNSVADGGTDFRYRV